MAASRPGQTQYRIQALRALAAAAVVFHHAGHEVVQAASRPSVLGAHPGLVALGACGVDVFFVISGFIIFFTMTRETGLTPAGTFLRNRFLRVVPLYWLWTSLLVLPMALGLLFTHHGLDLATAATSYLLIPYETQPGNTHPILDPGWTLSFELYFYAVTGLLIARVPHGLRLPGLVAALVVVQLMVSATPVPEAIRLWLAAPLVYEFAAGAAIAAAFRSERVPFARPGAHPRLGLGLIGLGAAGLAATAALPDATAWRVVLWGGPAALMVLGAVLANAPPRGPAARLLVRLGAASYSLYLTHIFAMIALGAALKRGHLQGLDPDCLVLAAAAATVALGSATYPVVERPLLALFRTRPPPYAPRADAASLPAA